jgi:HlyD family secretion protein
MKSKNPNRANKIIRYAVYFLLSAAIWFCVFCSWDPVQSAEVPKSHTASKPGYSAVSKGRVDVEGGLVNLAAKRDGIVEKVLVREGDMVRTGQALAALDHEVQRMALKVARGELAQARAAQSVIRHQINIAAEEERRFRAVYKKGGVAELKYLQYKNQLDVLRAKLQETRVLAETARSRVEQAEYELERSMILAPADGMIVRRKVRPGDGVSTLNVTPLFVFAPDLPLIVRAELDERFMHRVKSGDRAQVISEADDSMIFPARVIRVGKVFGQQHLSADDPSQRQDVRVLEVELGFTQKPDLLIGQRVLVHYLKNAPYSVPQKPKKTLERPFSRFNPLDPSPGFHPDSLHLAGPGGA